MSGHNANRKAARRFQALRQRHAAMRVTTVAVDTGDEQNDAADLDKAFERRRLGKVIFVSLPPTHTSETAAKLHPSPPPAIHRLDRASSNILFSRSSKQSIYSPKFSRITSYSYSPA